MTRSLLLATMVLTLAAPVRANPDAATVRVGAHAGFGRVVFELPALAGFSVERLGDMAIIHFDGAGAIPGAGAGTRNVIAVRGGDSEAVIELAAGTRLRTARMGNRVVVDVQDPVRRDASAQHRSGLAVLEKVVPPPIAAPETKVLPPAPAVPLAVHQAPLASPTTLFAPAPAPVSTAPAEPVHEATPALPPPPAPAPMEPMALAATRQELPPGTVGTAALLPFGAKVGAAAYRRNGAAWIVFDERRPVDMAALRDGSVLADATVQLLATATVLRIPLAEGAALRLTRQLAGWSVAALPAANIVDPLIPVVREGHLLLPAAAGSVVVVPDAETGQNLLVGTLRGVSAGVPVAYRQPEFILQPSWEGLLVEPLSDQVSLRAVPAGFVLETGAPILPPPSAMAALNLSSSLTRRFDFPANPPADLMRRLQSQVAQAGEAPPQSRAQPRMAAAQTMIALGMGAEAQSVLSLAVEEDPRLAASPDAQGLTAIAALLSGRIAETAALDDPLLSGSDEIALWRAVRAAELQEGAPEAAPVFASTLPLILSYPQALQNRLLPLAIETMALGGASGSADAVLTKRPDDTRLTYARALRLEANGDAKGALAAYDALADGRDRLAGARAATRATSLRMSSGAITPTEAAKSFERQFLAWRGDARERDLRLRVATLQGQAGAWRPAFDLLRETSTLYPEATGLINGRRTELLHDLLAGAAAAAIPPIDLVALADENAELVASVAPTEVAALLADKLVSLDLPRRAEPLLERMTRVASGATKAELGLRLASIRFGLGDDAGAATALDSSVAADMGATLMKDRVMLGAMVSAHRGNPGAAAASLALLDTPAADDLSATILTEARDWPAAERVLQNLADKTVPATGVIDPLQQETLLRLATAQQRAGDAAALYALGKQMSGRMSGPRADMFRLLTAAPVAGVGDLRRASSEIALARSIPSALAAIGSR